MLRILMCGVVALLAVGCSSGTSSDREAAREALGVCVSFYEVTDDVKAGVLSDSDIEPRMSAVWDEARNIDNDDIRDGVQGTLAALNQGDSLSVPLARVDGECSRLIELHGD